MVRHVSARALFESFLLDINVILCRTFQGAVLRMQCPSFCAAHKLAAIIP
jgi:hypothetical protein